MSGTSQNWDEGVGYDYIPSTTVIFEDKNYSDSKYIDSYWKNNLIVDQSKTKINVFYNSLR